MYSKRLNSFLFFFICVVLSIKVSEAQVYKNKSDKVADSITFINKYQQALQISNQTEKALAFNALIYEVNPTQFRFTPLHKAICQNILKLYNNHPIDSIKARGYYDLCHLSYHYKKPDSAYYFGTKWLEESLKSKNNKLIWYAYFNLNDYYIRMNDTSNAIKYYDLVLKYLPAEYSNQYFQDLCTRLSLGMGSFLSKKQPQEYEAFLDQKIQFFHNKNQKIMEGRFLTLKANHYLVLDRTNDFLEAYIKGIRVIEASTNNTDPNFFIKDTYFDIAYKLHGFKNLTLALEFYGKFVDACLDTEAKKDKSITALAYSPFDVVQALLNMNAIYDDLEVYDSVRVVCEKAVKISAYIPDPKHPLVSASKFFLARGYVKLQMPKKAISILEPLYVQDSIKIKKNIHEKINTFVSTYLGIAYEQLNDYGHHKEYYYKSNASYRHYLFKNTDSIPESVLSRHLDALEFLIRGAMKFFDYENLDRKVEKAILIAKKVSQFKVNKEASEGLAKYDYENKQKLIKALEKQKILEAQTNKTQKQLLYLFTFGLVVTSVLGYYALQKSRANKKANIALTEKNNQVVQQKTQLESAYEELNATLEQVNQQKQEIQLKNTKIEDSIDYASKIQNAFLPSQKAMKTAFPDSFVFFLPRDVVSGDFYWLRKVNDLTFMVVADCTGHGVPGAFMSLVASNSLFQVVEESKITDPSEALAAVDKRIRMALRQDQNKESKDGMDAVICIFPQDRSWVQYAGAGRPLFLLRGSEIIEFEADKFPVGGAQHENKTFTSHVIRLHPKDRLYLFTDGVTDQFGGAQKRKFTPKRLKDFVIQNNHLNMEQQGSLFAQTFANWMNESSAHALDDVTLVGIEV